MSKLSNALKNIAKPKSPNQVVKDNGNQAVTFTVNGCDYRANPYRNENGTPNNKGKGDGHSYVLHTAEGVNIWATGYGLEHGIIELLENSCGDVAEMNAALAKEPQLIRIHPLATNKDGNTFRPIDYLGDALESAEYDEEEISG